MGVCGVKIPISGASRVRWHRVKIGLWNWVWDLGEGERGGDADTDRGGKIFGAFSVLSACYEWQIVECGNGS